MYGKWCVEIFFYSEINYLQLYISNAMQKLGVKGRSQAVVELLRMGELEL
ncbi:hypothetical protein [Bacillus paranthracis]